MVHPDASGRGEDVIRMALRFTLDRAEQYVPLLA